MVTPGGGPLRDDVNGYPIQLAKVQRPALREETLERPRLLDWLRAKVHGRVVLLLADAGYGKTTLLADFSRRSRIRTLWYRLDEDDRDWVSFLHHLVASGRQHDPTFAPATADLLTQIGVGGPGREAVLDTFIRELPTIVVGGAVLIFDDFHIVDDAADVRHITRELVARAPERMTIAFASRRVPAVPLARLRTVGEVAELSTNDLRFDTSETAQLFTETYGRNLEPDVLSDLTMRTEGWIASLQLVHAALRDRSPVEVRRFVRSLSGADHEMYDYFAEEVVGDLEDELQRFLMETSILQVVTPELAEVVSGREPADVARLTLAAERLTLLSRISGGPRTHQRYHPLVREFLEARFRSIDGSEAVAAMHRRAGAAAAGTDWRIAAHHYREGGDTQSVLDIVADAIPTIMGNGQFAVAEAAIGQIPANRRPAAFDLILSRVEMQHGDYESAVAASQAVLDSDSTDHIQRDHALLNLLTFSLNCGDGLAARGYANRLLEATADPNLRMIADASISIVDVAADGDIEVLNRKFRSMATVQRATRYHHYGVAMFNLAGNSLAQDRLQDGLREVGEAIDALRATSGSVELASARTLRMMLLASIGDWSQLSLAYAEFAGDPSLSQDPDAMIELADISDSFGEPTELWALIDQVRRAEGVSAFRGLLATVLARAHARRGNHAAAADAISRYPETDLSFTASRTILLFTQAYLATAAGLPDALARSRTATASARRQSAHRWRRLGDLITAINEGPASLEQAISSLAPSTPWHLTYLADLLVERLDSLNVASQVALVSAARVHPDRWRFALRALLDIEGTGPQLAAANLLEEIGEREDVARLRKVAKAHRRHRSMSLLGRTLARRTAPRVDIEDQGRVKLTIEDRTVPGSEVRRKVLALLCFLLTRPGLSGTRDQVLDALWPELDPEVAVNSLNQTLYFLRRVFEEDYSEDLSPGYVNHDSDVIWLDPSLVWHRSGACRALIRELPEQPSPDDVHRLVATYQGRFALDFEYEEWAAAYRDSLHAAYLEIVERSVSDDLSSGHHDRGIGVARRALEVDPGAEQVEVSLLRLYRASGAHAAAAEQYAHYAAVMREELGIEPPELDTL